MVFCGSGGILMNVMQRPILKLSGLLLLYLGGSIFLLNICSFQMCAALLICGIGAVVLLGTSLRENLPKEDIVGKTRTNLLFRGALAVMTGILSFTASDSIYYWLPVRKTVLFTVLWIAMMCIFSLSLDDEIPFRCIYLQAVCLAFTVTYIYMESSILVFAFFAVINLFMAFGGSVLSMGKTAAPPEQSGNES